MREMRDSGVEWIGEIPKDWNCCKQKYRFTLINGRAFKDNEFEEDGTYRILRVGNLFSNPVWYSSSLELEPDKYCEKGDLIYAWSMSYGPYIWNEEKVIYHYHIWKTKLVSDMDKMFSYYYMQALTESIKSQTHETTMGFVTMGIMNNSYIAYPRNIKEQKKINSYIQMSRLLSKTDSNHSLPVDYAKSCPYLMSFMKKYKIKEQIEKYYIKHPDEFGSEREQCLLWLNRNKINKYDELPKTNARLEALKEKAFTGGAEKYLWIPPSLPYYEMQGAYKNSKGFSKILVFSAWEMVPRMIGALVSYEAERLTVGKLVHQIKNQDKKNTGYFAEGSRRYPVARLRFNVSNGEVRGMSLFALLYPSKTLSDMYLPIESLNNHESLEVIEKSVRLKLKEKLAIIEEKYGDSGNNKEDARWYYLAPMLMDGVIYAKHWIEDIVWEMNTDEEDTTSEVRSSSKDKRNKGFIAHIDKLRSYLDAPEEIHLGRKPEDLLETLVNMVLGSPAICIYRSNGRSTARATSLAKVFVNNFNLPESTAIIDLAYGRCRDDNSHWQNVLKYCKDGCFQAMIDEYIHMLKETAGFQSDGNQYQIVHDMMMDSLKIHTATYIADTYPDFKKRINGADRKSDGCRIRSSYAVGFTKDAGDNSKVVMRKENIRNAFNSPMRPFVLATTSIGQEGLDFHNYCRVIMHWNLPSNPIDVGRILRTFKIKKNVEVTDNGKIII